MLHLYHDETPTDVEPVCPKHGCTLYPARPIPCPECEEEAEEDDGPVQYEVTCPACGATSVVDEEALLDGDPVCPSCGKPLDFEVTEE